MSCSACTSLYVGQLRVQPRDSPRYEVAYFNPHHGDISGLCNAALSGCWICVDLWRYFFKEKTPEEYVVSPFFMGRGPFVHIYYQSGTSYRFIEPSPGLHGEEPKDSTLILEFGLNSPMTKEVEAKKLVLEKVDATEDLFTFLRGVYPRHTAGGYMNIVDFDQNFCEVKRWNLVQSWITKCSASHSICRTRRRSPNIFPTRMIHVPFGPMAPELRYRLIDTTSQSPIGLGHNYLTLSHCWGKVQNPPYCTTSQNISERLRIGIARNGLPPTFKDAIDVALRLRVPFLWIDSLCIIQGDKDDWAVECTKMADVYMNSFLNISATSASSPKDGLSSSFVLRPRVVTTGWENQGRAGKYRVIDPDFWRERVTDAQVNSRGWVLQERCLAPRVLHFGFDQLLWECCELSASEECPDGLSTDYVGDYVGGLLDFKRTTNFLLPAIPIADPQIRDSYRKFHDIWQRLGDMYGRCELTQPDKDKLMAISGLARAIQHGLYDQYLAGLWKKNMIGDLLWRVHKVRRQTLGTVPDGPYYRRWESSKRATSYRAPSWSWASVDGLVRLGDYLDLSGKPVICEERGLICSVTSAPMVAILNVDTSLVVPHDPFGQVCGGKLVVRGQLHRLWTKQAFREPVTVFRATEEMVFDDIDEPLPWSTYDEAYFLPLASVARRWATPLPCLTESAAGLREILTSKIEKCGEIKHCQDSKSTPFLLNPAEEELAALDREDYYDTVAGIEICPTQDRGAFRRIGYMSIRIHRFRRLGGCMPGEELQSEVVSQGNESVCKPDTAATGDDMVTGIFEIV